MVLVAHDGELGHHRVVVVDSRGHGRSTRDDQPFGYNLMTDDVEAFIADMKTSRIACSPARKISIGEPNSQTANRMTVQMAVAGSPSQNAASNWFGLQGFEYLDLARLGVLGDRDLQQQDAAVVAGLDVLGVQVVAQDELAAEHPTRAFGSDELARAIAEAHGGTLTLENRTDRRGCRVHSSPGTRACGAGSSRSPRAPARTSS